MLASLAHLLPSAYLGASYLRQVPSHLLAMTSSAIILIFRLQVATFGGIVIAFLALGRRQLEEGVVLEDGHFVEDTVAVKLCRVAVHLVG